MYWYEKPGAEQDVYVSTRVRFARNIKDYPFEPILDKASAEEIIDKVKAVLGEKDYRSADEHRAVMAEKRLISREMREKKTPYAIMENDDVCIMVCEEDHLRIQSIKPGLDFEGAFEAASRAEALLDEKLEYAFDEKLGYLTHCPTNLGCAMRASVMMFLPCLSESGKMKAIERELAKLGVTVRGSGGEGSGSAGCLYQISNSVTLGVTEEEIISNVKSAAETVASMERELRRRINEQRGDRLRDRIMRSVGVAKYAYMMESEELYRLYSDIRLGAVLGMIDKPLPLVDKMLFENLPAHIVSREGKMLSSEERDKARAKGVSQML